MSTSHHKIALVASTLLLASTSSMAATEIMENGLGYDNKPTYSSMMLDTAVGRPVQSLFAVAGTITWVATLPLTLISNSHEEAGKVLVADPLEAVLYRCLGCTPKQDAVRRTYSYDPYRNYGYRDNGYQQPINYNSDKAAAPVVVHPYQP